MHNSKSKRFPIYFSHHFFNQPMDDLWRVISDMSLIPNIEDLASLKNYYPQLNLSFNDQYRVTIHLDPSFKVYYQMESKTVTDYCCSLIWKGYLAFSKLELFKSISTLHYISNEKSLLIIAYIFPYEYKQFIKEEAQRQAYYNSIDKFIASREHLKIQNETRVIKGEISTGINCLLNFMTCLDLVFDQNNGKQTPATIGMVISTNINKAYMINEKMDIIHKLVKVERKKNHLLIVSYSYDKAGKMPYRYCHLEVFSEDDDEIQDNDKANGKVINSNAKALCKESKKNFVMNFRHTFLSELNSLQLGYTKHYKNLFLNKFEQIVQKIEGRKILNGLS